MNVTKPVDQTLDAADEAITVDCRANVGKQPAVVKIFLKAVSTVSCVGIIEALAPGATTWQKQACINSADYTIVAGGNITLTNGTDYTFRIDDCVGLDYVRFRIVSISSGSLTANAVSLAAEEVATRVLPVSVAVSSLAQAITSSSATALAVGQNGTTTPAFLVDSSTASSTTGIKVKSAAGTGRAALSVISDQTNEGLSIDAKGSGTIRLGATSTGAVEFSVAAVPTTSDGVALGSATLQWADLFLAEGGVINWDNGDVTITQTNNVLAVAGITSVTIAGALTPATNDAGALGSTTLGWSDLFLATGGVINWANGEVTITETDANTIDIAGCSAWKFGAVTLNVTGTRITQSYHTNLTSTNAVTVDSSETVKEDIKQYEGDALDVIDRMSVVTFRHNGHVADDRTKLGIIAESVHEPLAIDPISRPDGTTYPGVNSYAMDTLSIRAIQQLHEKVRQLESRVAA